MELNYSGAKDLEAKRAIHKAFWDKAHELYADAKWITRDEFLRQSQEIAALNRKRKEEEKRRNEAGEQNPPDNPT